MQDIPTRFRGTLIAAALCAATVCAIAQNKENESSDGKPVDERILSPRYQRGMEVLSTLNKGNQQPVFEAMRKEFPFLADATASYALGDVWGRQVLPFAP